MPGSVIGITMDYGFPGQASRHGDEVSRTRPVSQGPIPFGAPVMQKKDGSVTAWTAKGTADDFAGIAMRKVKTATVWTTQDGWDYQTGQPCDILQRGGICVKCAWGEPKVGGKVYIRTKVDTSASPAGSAIGDLGASDEAGNCIVLDGVKWSSEKDARGVAELTMLTRKGL
ncbi:hypothetical protein [uncultured Acidaminococcus sp.]|uniref:structural cement protein Gp24 n=1 Tax=uncultured Acidaminococcus sp. TaxID=352152 RepID=UPI002593C759|nr:hypothetical protein [uncultured Acidaminococcus sp.]